MQLKQIRNWAFLLCVLCVSHGAAAQMPALEMRCHYLLGEKYSSEIDPEVRAAWLDSLGDGTLPTPYDLFSHQGGGPGGAEWNADHAVVLWWSLPAGSAKLATCTVRVNGRKWKHKEEFAGVTWRYIGDRLIAYRVLESAEWMERVVPVNAQNQRFAFSEIPPPDALAACQVLMVELEIHSKASKTKLRTTKAYAVSYGE